MEDQQSFNMLLQFFQAGTEPRLFVPNRTKKRAGDPNAWAGSYGCPEAVQLAASAHGCFGSSEAAAEMAHELNVKQARQIAPG